jgi:hypothetical protein
MKENQQKVVGAAVLLALNASTIVHAGSAAGDSAAAPEASRSKELMMPADRVILEYRDKLNEFESRGWRIDLAALRRTREEGCVIHALPSPERRISKSWVLDPVPLLAPQTAALAEAAS